MAYAPKPSPVAPPTIGFLKSQGVTATHVFCASIYCGRMVVVGFDDLGLPDDTPFPSIKGPPPLDVPTMRQPRGLCHAELA